MLRFHTVLFDLDGTLIDSADLIVESYQHAFRTHGLTVRSREEILAGMGTPLRAVFRTMTADEGAIDQWIATYRAYNLLHHDARVQAYPGVVEMIGQVRDCGCRLGLVTSKNRSGALRGLALIGLQDAMEIVVGADDVEHPKPDAEPVERALQLLDMPADSCLFVGDSHHDVLCGRNAGVRTAGITWGPFDRRHLEQVNPDYYCDTPADVVRIVQGEAA